jgi:hypothetical protein
MRKEEQRCLYCDRRIRMMIRFNTGWCSEQCEERHIAAVTKTPVGFE